VGSRADPAGWTSAPGPKVTEAQSRRGAELEAMIETRGASLDSPVGSLPLFLSSDGQQRVGSFLAVPVIKR